MNTVGRALKRMVIGTVPTFLKKILFGELLEELTKSQHITPQRLLDKGFVFQYPTLAEAIKEVVKKQ
jgi:NAD dependent epimerase/dehydratase family enzyme